MISHDYKIIFIHIPKCAGRSICDLFNQRFDHLTAQYYVREYSEHWSSYNKFTIVRDPYARMVSIYHYIKQHRRHLLEPIGFNGLMPDFKTWLISNIEKYQGNYFYNSPEGMRGTDGDIGSPFWFSSQARRISNISGELYKDLNIFKIEYGMEPVIDYLLPICKKELNIAHLNESEHKPYLSYYDQELIEISSQFEPILSDCRAFGYEILTSVKQKWL